MPPQRNFNIDFDSHSGWGSTFVYFFCGRSLIYVTSCALCCPKAKEEMNKGWFAYVSDEEASILDFDKAFHALEKLKGPLRDSLADFQVPYVVVVGNTSVGKSTLLRRLSRFPFFPSGGGICTRMPIRVEIRKPSANEITNTARMSVHSFDATTNKYLEDPKESIEIDLKDAIRTVKKKMEELSTQAVWSSNECPKEETIVITDLELRIRVVSENFPVLNLIDLPGIVRGQGDARRKLAETTEKLFERYRGFGGDESLFLCVVPATSATVDWDGAHLIQKEGLKGRSLGVITKCDGMNKQEKTDVIELLLETSQHESIKLEYGYVAVAADESQARAEAEMEKKLNQDERTTFKRLEDQLHESEKERFRKCTSIDRVRERVMNAYLKQVYERWLPNAASQLLKSWIASADEFNTLGFQSLPGCASSAGSDPAMEIMKNKVLQEVTCRWRTLTFKLAGSLAEFSQQLAREINPACRLQDYEEKAKGMLEELMTDLLKDEPTEAGKTLGDVEESPTFTDRGNVKLLHFGGFKQKLVETLKTSLEEQWVNRPKEVLFWFFKEHIAEEKSKAFVQEVIHSPEGVQDAQVSFQLLLVTRLLQR